MLGQLRHLRELELAKMPNLNFELSAMTNLEEWTEVEELIFPRLEKLEIKDCPKLTTVPGFFTVIKKLTVTNVNRISPLTSICRNLTTLTHLWINTVAELTYLPDRLLENNKSITNLNIIGSPIKSLIFPNLVSLEDLCIGNCEELTCLPSGLLQSYTSLSYLDVTNCDKLTCLPALSCLNRLYKLSLGAFSEELNSFPKQLQHLISLTYLKIDGFGIETLPNWFRNLSFLTTIEIYYCQKLEYLPNMESLTKLVDLYINRFPFEAEKACVVRDSPSDEHLE
ncbi:hypothetical protein LguiB_026980 [Lonicera macranthoides]